MSAAGPRRTVTAALSPLDRPLTSYYLIIGTTGLLLSIGLVMVLSSSSASQLDLGASPYGVFAKQLVGALVGVALMWALARFPPRLFRAVAYPLFVVALGALVMVLLFGVTENGATRWLDVPVLGRVQPSEFAKLAFLIWGANLLARKEDLGQLKDWRTLLIPLLPGAALLGLLVILGDDLGTTFLLLVILLALLWVIGTPARLFAGVLGLIIFALLLLIEVAQYRSGRITSFLHPTLANDWQLIQGKYAIGSGGWFGVGLGDSQQKWGWLPNADTDFIFAILGEELGLVGTGCVVLLYGGLAFAGLRVARRMADPFIRLAAAGATAWIVCQALVNICAVVGLLPITGVPLPLISQGSSSVLATMAATGMLLSFAKCEPGAREALIALGARRRRRLPAILRREPLIAHVASSARQPADRPRPARPGQTRQSAQSRLADPGRSVSPGGPGRQGGPRTAQAGRGPGQPAAGLRATRPRGTVPRGTVARGTVPGDAGPRGARG